MKLFNFTVLPVICAFVALLSGCADSEHAALSTPALGETPSALAFSEQVAALPEGTVQYFAEGSFGAVAIEAGPQYLSGMGNECRLVLLTRGSMSYRSALCKGENGTWRFIPTVFESIPQ